MHGINGEKTGRLRQIEEDNTLVAAAQKNARDFAPLYEKYWEPLYRFIFQRIAEEDYVQDIAQQVMIKAMNNIGKYQPRGYAFSSWLFRIAISEISNAVKKHQAERASRVVSTEMEAFNTDLEDDFTGARIPLLVELLNKLKPEELDMIEMRYFEKRKLKDVAEILKITEVNAKVRMHRIMTKLKSLAKEK